MVHPSVIEARLGELRFRCSCWFKAEVHELQHILMEHEKIIALACGRYFGSYALLVATDQRLLLIDKRVFFMTIEDTRYDMISEIDFNTQAYYANLTIYTVNKTHKFTSIKHRRQLREVTNYIQKRVAEMRSQQSVPLPGTAQAPEPADQSTVPAMPALGTSYDYSSTTTDDAATLPAEPPPHGVAQLVGSAAMQATHLWPRRPINPYVQGSLMTRGPISTAQTQTEY
jgi:hypothetical protein